jgi:hypothetical protein
LVCGGCLDFKLMTTVSSDADDLSLCITKWSRLRFRFDLFVLED